MLAEKYKIVIGEGWITGGLNVQYKVVDGVLYFQCTHGMSDWLFNFFAAKVTYDEHGITVTAHAGFAALWLSVRSDIEKLSYSEIDGYSEGSALAAAAHLNYVARMGKEPNSYAFATPRYFDRKTAKSLGKWFTHFHRINNKWDIVKHVPFAGWYFRHVGKEILTTSKAKRPIGCSLLRWLSGHSPEEYMQTLAKM